MLRGHCFTSVRAQRRVGEGTQRPVSPQIGNGSFTTSLDFYDLTIDDVVAQAPDFELLILHTSTPSLAQDSKTAARMKEANPRLRVGLVVRAGFRAELVDEGPECVGQGGVGYAFTGGEVVRTYPNIEDQLRFVYWGSAEYALAGVDISGDPNREGGPHITGAQGVMPAQGAEAGGALTDYEILGVDHYVVKNGDSIWKIAQRLELPYWVLTNLNPGVTSPAVGDKLIAPVAKVRKPSKEPPSTQGG